MQNQILEALKWRYAVKKYDPTKKISPENWSIIEQALQLTASSYGLQPWRFIIVQSPEIREKLLPFSLWNKGLVSECSHLLVIATKTNLDETYIDFHLTELAKTRGIDFEGQITPPALKGYRDMMVGNLLSWKPQELSQWAAKQGYIALGNALTVASLLKIDSTPVEGFEEAGYNSVLGLSDAGYRTTLVCPFGYRSEDDKYANAKKFRFSKEFLFKTL